MCARNNFVLGNYVIEVCTINNYLLYPRPLRQLDFKWSLVLFVDEALLYSEGER